MPTRTTTKLLREAVASDLGRRFSDLGFTERSPCAFYRPCGNVVHGIFVRSNPSATHICVEAGATVPELHETLDQLRGEQCDSLLFSRPLGLLTNATQGSRTYYHFATLEQLYEAFPQIHEDFVAQAEPWLASLVTVDQVAKEFFKWRLGPVSNGQQRQPDPYAWAIYGWILRADGRRMEADPWLERAREYLIQPEHMKQERLIPRTLSGSLPISLSKEDCRMLQLLNRDLGKE